MTDIRDELAILAKNTPAIKPFLQKFQEYLEGGIEVIDAQWTTYTDFEGLQKLGGEKEAYQKIMDFLELLIRPEKENETEE